jgi:hypothetical protein
MSESQLNERRVVECPYHLAQQYLDYFLREVARTKKPDVVTLRVPVASSELTKKVEVTVAHGYDPMHFDHPWSLHWTPEGGGPYPDFDGELTVRADEDYTSSILELVGEYRPPGGALGAAFDWVAGRRIASATAQALLREIGNGMITEYRRDEAAKAEQARE